MSIEEYFGHWLRVIDKEELFKALHNLQSLNKSLLCPNYSDIFKAFELCNYNNLSVIIVGQDPYPQKGVATGIAFGNKLGTEELSPSLEVIKESCIDYTIPHNPIEFDITLESWAKQGVLMLNSALTCEVNKVGSHVMLWRPFISKLLRNLSEREAGLIYLLLGSQAKTFKPYINKQYNTILELEHPAYFARTNRTMPSIFSHINQLLKDKYDTTIEWYHEY
jgi:uracil-DNA glycosylase